MSDQEKGPARASRFEIDQISLSDFVVMLKSRIDTPGSNVRSDELKRAETGNHPKPGFDDEYPLVGIRFHDVGSFELLQGSRRRRTRHRRSQRPSAARSGKHPGELQGLYRTGHRLRIRCRQNR